MRTSDIHKFLHELPKEVLNPINQITPLNDLSSDIYAYYTYDVKITIAPLDILNYLEEFIVTGEMVGEPQFLTMLQILRKTY